jgi:hypothetical protein
MVLYGDALINNRVDAVGWHQAGGDPATALDSRYGCPALDTTIVAAGASVQNVSLSVPVGVVGDSDKWVKTPQ